MNREQLEQAIKAHGYTVRYVEYCESSRTPGLLGQIRGVLDIEHKEVRIGTKANPTPTAILDILAHELRHIEQPDWDCGSRDVIGRGA